MLKEINTDKAPKAIGPYSQAVRAGQFLFVSGQLPINPQTGKVDDGTIEGQTRQVLANIEAILQAAGLSFNDVAKCEVYLKDMQDFQAMNGIYAEKFSGPVKPARQAMQVGKLPMDVRVEISCFALIK